ncbi:MAG TPA: hypothetical protein VM140_04840 [Burkholderiales bacterium]|nr:hypothetical protein [Burkholderiales bacterium]
MLLAGCASAPPPGAVVFGLLGDTPYNSREVERLEGLIDDINSESLAFVAHVGDIGGGSLGCGDAWLQARKIQFARIRHPFVLLPGDNEWSDCPRPLERLSAWRKTFCFQEKDFPLDRQPGEFCEHVRWQAGGLVFVALNVQGSNNNVRHAEHGPRMALVISWLDEAARLAEKQRGLVVLMQADPFIVLPQDGFAELRNKLAALGERMPGRVILVHGDSHVYHDDEPIPGVRRLEVWGSPVVSWIRGEITPEGVRFSAPRYR